MSSAIYPSLKGRKVLITGGGSGIGAGLVEAFVKQGAQVSFIDLADTISEQLPAGAATFYKCDLTDIPALERTLAQIGTVDILLNNAANDDRHSLGDVTEAYFDNRIAVNLKHLLFCAKAVAPGMKANGGGAIINFGSISWHLGLPDLVLYETAKAGIEGMTRALARELGPDNIRVTTIIPGNVKTPRQMKWYTPEGERQIVEAQCLPGRIEPKHVAGLALFLASDDAELCTGHGYWIDAGWR
ncbi:MULTISPECIES: SDR family NAD(P)-dependent oxidoreductase [Asticcacaulis]|uniref:SDR family NAD(P)-dependent oxidoreductase n=1 Tax=Asticcacaulis TaxID=76890 RepID=UPI001AE78D42|nr:MULTISPECIES: SDR family oxidoreductase [Asticcacaulis]MBP2159456.1 NAD(P)-dependent dehydrogenase (short-subunit alcohol dehydrogenase family) [Asticcacaulis solisilvae]MDR6800717.1 NAD(P)-dependent dehydrogenase (short-subunit alcohol dehydrogenase family) [Asticcacaulis sp. BE141]